MLTLIQQLDNSAGVIWTWYGYNA